MEELDTIFKNNLPDVLMMDHYTLSRQFGHLPTEWRQYLKDNEHFITSETAAIAEANARAALSRLGAGATSQEVTAIKALLEKSKLINDAQKQQQHVLITYMPSKGQQEETKTTEELKKQVEFLRQFRQYTIYLVQSERYDERIHTEQWFKRYMEGE
jgi:hypothetical protein